MSICIKDQIQNMNLVIGCTVGCTYCYARNNVKRWHMIDDFADPEFFPGKLRMMEKKRPQNFLLTGMSDLSGWKPEWRDEVFAKIRENPQHQFLFLTKRPDLLDFCFCEQSSQKTRELSLRSKRYFLCLSQEGSSFCASRSALR